MSGCSGDPGQPTLGKFPGITIAAGRYDLLLLVSLRKSNLRCVHLPFDSELAENIQDFSSSA